ncbi:MAG TPA: acetate uptake transporter [Ktedonobacteraceae bacterium]|nr:acetate uptake transporter [Ktedonobacteraceae bacterium]
MAQLAADRSEQPAVAATTSANPAPLGLFGFGLTTFVLSSINAGFIIPQGVGTTIVLGLAIFYGGLGQLLAGMWEFRAGNTFGATAFTSYGAFWLSFAVIFIPGFGVLAAFTGKAAASLGTALGIYLLGWTIITALLTLGTLRSNVALLSVFVLLTLTFLFLAIGALGGSTGMTAIGGWLGILTALVAWYTALAGLLASGRNAFALPTWPLR